MIATYFQQFLKATAFYFLGLLLGALLLVRDEAKWARFLDQVRTHGGESWVALLEKGAPFPLAVARPHSAQPPQKKTPSQP